MSQDIYAILSLEDKGVSEALNTPAKLFRLVCLDKGVSKIKWDKLLSQYLNSARSGVSKDKLSLSFTRSNLNRALGKKTITWDKLKTGLSILHKGKIEVKIELNWCDGLIHEVVPPKEITKELTIRSSDLCHMFRKCYTALELTPMGWNTLVEKWIDDPANALPANKPERSWERGNIRKHILDSNSYTWATSIKALSIIGVKDATMSILLHKGENHTIHSCKFKVKKYVKVK